MSDILQSIKDGLDVLGKPGVQFTENQKNMILSISVSRLYKYKSLVFTHHDYLGPQILRHKDHEVTWRKIGLRQWGEFHQWYMLDDVNREKYRIN